MEIYYDCFTSNLDDYGNLDISYKKFDSIYPALIYAYKKSFVQFKPNVPNKNQFYPGYQYKSIVRKFTINYCHEIKNEPNFPIIVYHDKIRKARFIQRKFRESIANPYTELCRRRLLREFNEM